MRHTSWRASAIFAALALTSSIAGAGVVVTVSNPNFTTPMPTIGPGTPATTAATCLLPEVGISASKDWTTYANDVHASITSWLTVAPDGTPANLTAIGGDQSGLVQVLAVPQGTATNVNRVTATVFVLGGRMSVQIGDGGSGGGAVAPSTTLLGWETISACGRPDMLNNEIVLYGVGPSVFYVRNVSVSFDPKCPMCHAPDKEGPPMANSCGTCAAKVCSIDSYCCEVTWDGVCVSEAAIFGPLGGC
jgi:hypothetical protein